MRICLARYLGWFQDARISSRSGSWIVRRFIWSGGCCFDGSTCVSVSCSCSMDMLIDGELVSIVRVLVLLYLCVLDLDLARVLDTCLMGELVEPTCSSFCDLVADDAMNAGD